MLATAAVTLYLTVTLVLPGFGPRTAEIPFDMPDLAACEAKGRASVARSDETRTFAFVCRERA